MAHAANVKQIQRVLAPWLANPEPEFLVYLLNHQYTEASIRASELKGTDLQRLHCLMQCQLEMGFMLCLASLEKTRSGSVNDGDYYDGAHLLHEVYHESLRLKKVFDICGNLMLRDVEIDEEQEIVQNIRFAEAKPDNEEYEGFTGNTGAQATHWYRVSRGMSCHDNVR